MPKPECSISPSSTRDRSIASRIAVPPSSGALKDDNAPPNFPNGVRAAPKTTALSTTNPPSSKPITPLADGDLVVPPPTVRHIGRPSSVTLLDLAVKQEALDLAARRPCHT